MKLFAARAKVVGSTGNRTYRDMKANPNTLKHTHGVGWFNHFYVVIVMKPDADRPNQFDFILTGYSQFGFQQEQYKGTALYDWVAGTCFKTDDEKLFSISENSPVYSLKLYSWQKIHVCMCYRNW